MTHRKDRVWGWAPAENHILWIIFSLRRNINCWKCLKGRRANINFWFVPWWNRFLSRRLVHIKTNQNFTCLLNLLKKKKKNYKKKSQCLRYSYIAPLLMLILLHDRSSAVCDLHFEDCCPYPISTCAAILGSSEWIFILCQCRTDQNQNNLNEQVHWCGLILNKVGVCLNRLRRTAESREQSKNVKHPCSD